MNSLKAENFGDFTFKGIVPLHRRFLITQVKLNIIENQCFYKKSNSYNVQKL